MTLFHSGWDVDFCACNILDKDKSIRHYIRTMISRTSSMFEYTGLPDTIPEYMLERMLQLNGHVAITEVKGNLYALAGKFGGEPDPYYRPTMYVVANPALAFSGSLSVVNYLPPHNKQATQGECVVVRNDATSEGLLYMYNRYATQLTENDVSIRSAQINSRQQAFIKASTATEIESASRYIADLENGKLSAVASSDFLDGIEAANISVMGANNIIQLIELQQYLKASWFNEIGLNANFNMKREYMSEEEIATTTDVLLPMVDDMLKRRQEDFDVVNSTYGTNISVRKNSAWSNKEQEVNSALTAAENEAKEAGE